MGPARIRTHGWRPMCLAGLASVLLILSVGGLAPCLYVWEPADLGRRVTSPAPAPRLHRGLPLPGEEWPRAQPLEPGADIQRSSDSRPLPLQPELQLYLVFGVFFLGPVAFHLLLSDMLRHSASKAHAILSLREGVGDDRPARQPRLPPLRSGGREFAEEFARLALLFGGIGPVQELIGYLPNVPRWDVPAALAQHPDLLAVWEEEGGHPFAMVVEAVQMCFPIPLPPLPLRGIVTWVDPLLRYGFVAGAEGDAFLPGKFLAGGFRDGERPYGKVLSPGAEISYDTHRDAAGRLRVTEIQAFEPPPAEEPLPMGPGLAQLLAALPLPEGPAPLVRPLGACAVDCATGQVRRGARPPLYRPPPCPVFLPRQGAPQPPTLRLGMPNLLRLARLLGADETAYDVVGMSGALLALMDMTIDAAGAELGRAWFGDSEAMRGRRRHDSVVVQRCGKTLLFDQGFLPFAADHSSLASEFERRCVERQDPQVQVYHLGQVFVQGLALLVGCLPDGVTEAGQLVEVKLREHPTARDAVQCLLQGTGVYCHGAPTHVGLDLAVLRLHEPPVLDLFPLDPFLSHLRGMVRLVGQLVREERAVFTLRRTVAGLLLSRVPLEHGLARPAPA